MISPFLVGEKVYLRSVDKNDLVKMINLANDQEVTKHMVMGTFPSTLEGLTYEYNTMREKEGASLLQLPVLPHNIIFAITKKDGDDYIGNIGLFGLNWFFRIAELRVVTNKEYWGGGYTDEAYRLLLTYAFDRLSLRRIYAGYLETNVGVAITSRKAGFVKEGVRRKHFLRNGIGYDVIEIGMLREDFEKTFGKTRLVAEKRKEAESD